MTSLLSTGKHHITLKQPLHLQCGAVLEHPEVTYEIYGPETAVTNVVLIQHSLATNSHVASHAGDSSQGWWEALVGPGKAIDTNQYLVICMNNLGSCYGSSGPLSINPQTNKAYQATFPEITFEDMVHCQRMALEKLGITKIHTVIGGSMGGMLALAWAQLYPELIEHLIAISMAHKAYPLQLAHRMTQREAIQFDSVRGLKLARMIAHLFYRGLEEIDNRFDEEILEVSDDGPAVVNYYHYNAEKFAHQFNANSYLLFLGAMDKFNLEFYGNALFEKLTAQVTLIGTDTDVLYPLRQQQAVHELMKDKVSSVKLIEHHSPYGHDAFLVDAEAMGRYVVEAMNARFTSVL